MADRSLRVSDELFIRFADSDSHWGPLLFLRPREVEILGLARVLALSLLFGSGFGLFGSILLSLVARVTARPPLAVHVFPLALTALYFCACQLTFVPAWNRRAKRLARAS